MVKAYILLFTIVYILNKLKLHEAKLDHFEGEGEGTIDENNFVKFVCDVIYSHEDFEMTFHFDNGYTNLVDKVIMDINNSTVKSVNLIYYDENVYFDDLFTRPLVRKILNIIILREMDNFVLFLNKTENVNEHDEALFVIPDIDIDKTFLFTDWRIKIFGKILVICVDDQARREVNVNVICYFCGKSSNKISQIATNGALSSKLTFDKKEFKNFFQHTFKVGFTEYYPFISCKQIEETTIDNITTHTCLKATGSEYELITMMSQRLNFTYELILYPSYTQLINDLEVAKIDFVVGGITATSERADKTTFTRQYWFEGYYFLYILSTNLKQELGRVLDPFDRHLWLLLATSIFVTSAVLYALDRVESTGIGRITCSESLWVCLYMAIEQNANIKQVFKVRPGPAILLIAWILVCLNVSTAYKSKLSAIVMNPPYREPGDLEELVENDYRFVVNDRYIDVFMALLFNTSDSTVQKAFGRTASRENLCEEFIYAVENRAAILDEYTSLQYELRRTCKGEIRAKRKETEIMGNAQIRITKKSLRTIGQVWLLQKRAAYRSGFDEILGRIVEAGLVEMWKITYTKDMLKDSFPESRNTNMEHYHTPLSLRLLLSLFLVYAIGNLSAMFVFIVETILHHRKYTNVLRKNSIYKPTHHSETIEE